MCDSHAYEVTVKTVTKVDVNKSQSKLPDFTVWIQFNTESTVYYIETSEPLDWM